VILQAKIPFLNPWAGDLNCRWAFGKDTNPAQGLAEDLVPVLCNKMDKLANIFSQHGNRESRA
jgi:hypothetical protein